MKCPYCSSDNPDGSKFCGSCGKEMQNTINTQGNQSYNQNFNNQPQSQQGSYKQYGQSQESQSSFVQTPNPNPLPSQKQQSQSQFQGGVNQAFIGKEESMPNQQPVNKDVGGSSFAGQVQEQQGSYDSQMSKVHEIETEAKKPWYATPVGLIFFIFLAGPLFGILLWFLWKKEEASKTLKWVVTIGLFLLQVIFYTFAGGYSY